MGKVMATLIESAEQAAREQRLAREHAARLEARTQALVDAPTASTDAIPHASADRAGQERTVQESVAVQEP